MLVLLLSTVTSTTINSMVAELSLELRALVTFLLNISLCCLDKKREDAARKSEATFWSSF